MTPANNAEPAWAPPDRITRSELLDGIHRARARFDQVVRRIPQARMSEAVLPGGWSVKDVLAHITWGEREAIGIMQAHALVGSDLWDLSEDERNAAVVEESRAQSLDGVLSAYTSVFDEYLRAVAGLSDEDLNEPARFAGLSERIPGWRPWRVIHDPGHYEEHARMIEDAFS